MRFGGSAISFKDLHPEKAYFPTSVRLGGSVISLKEVRSSKAVCSNGGPINRPNPIKDVLRDVTAIIHNTQYTTVASHRVRK